MIYHLSWLEQAVIKFKEEDFIHSVDGNMTIEEFINLTRDIESEKVYKLD